MVSSPYKPIDEHPTPIEALVDVVHTAQRLVVSRIDLLRLEAKEAAARAARASALFGVAAFLGVLGWIALMAAVVALLEDPLTLAGALALVGAVHVAAAIALGVAGAVTAPNKEKVVVQTKRPTEEIERTERPRSGAPRMQMEGA